ncbi:hypothetical protein [Alkalihalobacterium chitinilyticum]|uniref:Phenylalanyl-tRNA synthetase subunit beta n=1 Tax=Alkalihalobacterium chitinilyticum TaxID=2980103 RepID=A0ABT5VFU6_9BACI|nr:hypothetical protein [Alkalihalobacterium chitinilyticum]MDE5414333.1 hypothetical protein [Alkalihalobacterium chitinilyticum]
MWKWIVITLVIIGSLGYWGYNFFISKASEVLVEQITNDILNDEEEYNKLINDPHIQNLIKEIDKDQVSNNLPFETKEDAMKTILREFSTSEINEVKDQALRGNVNTLDVLNKLQDRLTPDEVAAIQVILAKELQSQ